MDTFTLNSIYTLNKKITVMRKYLLDTYHKNTMLHKNTIWCLFIMSIFLRNSKISYFIFLSITLAGSTIPTFVEAKAARYFILTADSDKNLRIKGAVKLNNEHNWRWKTPASHYLKGEFYNDTFEVRNKSGDGLTFVLGLHKKYQTEYVKGTEHEDFNHPYAIGKIIAVRPIGAGLEFKGCTERDKFSRGGYCLLKIFSKR